MKLFFNPFLVLVLLVFLFLSTSLLLDDPSVWPDEAIYGDISLNILHEGRVGTDLLKGLIQGVENHAYWIPPLFMYTNAVWFKLFGFSIIAQRLLSVFLATLLLIVFYQLSKSFISSKNPFLKQYLPVVTTLLLAVDAVFLKAARISRPEMLVLVVAMGALILYNQVSKKTKYQNYYLISSGLLLGLAITAHLIAICFASAFGIYLIYSYRKKLTTFKQLCLMFLSFTVPIVIWLISIFPNYDLLINQLSLISESRNFTIPWYTTISQFSSYPVRINYALYILISLVFLYLILDSGKSRGFLLGAILIMSWIFTTLGELHWYTIYPVAFFYLALGTPLDNAFNNLQKKDPFSSLRKSVWVSICLILFISNLVVYFDIFNIYSGTRSYDTFKKQIQKIIPEGRTVYLTSIPEAYYALNSSSSRLHKNKLYTYPAFPANMSDYQKVLSDVDFIIFNGTFMPPDLSSYLNSYIEKNKLRTWGLTYPYNLMIIELKNKDQRVSPSTD